MTSWREQWRVHGVGVGGPSVVWSLVVKHTETLSTCRNALGPAPHTEKSTFALVGPDSGNETECVAQAVVLLGGISLVVVGPDPSENVTVVPVAWLAFA